MARINNISNIDLSDTSDSFEDYERQYIKTLDNIRRDNINKEKRERDKLLKELAKQEIALKKQGLASEIKNEKQLRTKLLKDLQEEQIKQNKEVLIKQNAEMIKLLSSSSSKLGSAIQDLTLKAQTKSLELLASDNKFKKLAGSFLGNFGNIEETIKKLDDTMKKIGNEVNATISKYNDYIMRTNARLQGTNLTFSSISDSLLSKTGASPYIRTEKMLDNLTTLISSGISFNIEQRAFLSTISEEIAQTFDAFDSNLTRLIRLQQTDITASRLGLEAYLTRFFNENFADTSYLNSSFDAVSGALLEASSTMSASAATSFEYVVQKWLGSLESVGFSQSTISNIAQALGYLGSGDVSSLQGSSANNLLVMAASRMTEGKTYAQMLSEGLDASSVNSLLESMVEYLYSISQTSNQVVKSSYASLFGLSMSDLTAIANLYPLVNDISKSMMTYNDTLSELQYQFGQVGDRLTIAGQIQNLIANAKFSLGANIADNPAAAATWAITDLIGSVTSGINIPTVGAAGFFMDLETTVENLVKLGLVGVSTFSTIGDIINGLGGTNRLFENFNLGNVSALTLGGSGLQIRKSGMGSSTMSYVGNTSASSIYESALGEARQSAEEQVSGYNDEDNNPVYQIKNYLIDTFDAKLNRFLGVGGIASINDELNQIKTLSANQVVVTSSSEDKNAEYTSQIENIDNNVQNIFNLLEDIAYGTAHLTVRTEQ